MLKKGFVKPARLPKGAYTVDFKEKLGGYMSKSTAKNMFIIKKKPDDTLDGAKILRIAIGGNGRRGHYLVYRGDLAEVRDLVGAAYRALSVMTTEPEITE